MWQTLHVFCLAILLGLGKLASAQPDIQWQKCLGGSSSEEAHSIEQTTDGGYIIAGYSSSLDGDVYGIHGLTDAWLVKLDSTGTIDWQKCLGGSSNDEAYSIEQTTDGGFIVTGEAYSNDGDVSGNHGSSDAWVVKLNGTGGLQWQKCLGGTSLERAYSIHQTTDGGYIVAGEAYANGGDVIGIHGGSDAWVVKLDDFGTILWQKCLGGSGTETARSIQQTTDGGYIMAGQALSSNDGDVSGNHGGSDAWVVKLDAIGSLQWQKCLGGSGYEFGYSIQQTTDGGYIMAGRAGSTDGDVSGIHAGAGADAWLVKLDGAGTIQWQKCLGGSHLDEAWTVQQTPDGGYLAAGYTYSVDGDVTGKHGEYYPDGWAFKINSYGVLQWQKCLGGSVEEYINCINPTAEGGCVVVGVTNSSDGDVTSTHGSWDAWVLKLSPNIVSVDEEAFEKSSISPNPTHASFIIRSTTSDRPNFISLFDVTGCALQTQHAITSEPFSFDLSNYADGLYLVQIRYADGTQSILRVMKE